MPEHGSIAGIRNVTVVGGGVIGASWTALFLARGLSVIVSDPQPGIDEAALGQIAEAAPSLKALGLDTSRLTDRLAFEPDLATAVRAADLVQENGPERLELKHEMWRTIEENAPATALLATSTSGIPATEIATALKDPGRLVVGHPFNPPHLVPLVEVVPGERTSDETVERARAFYRALGKRPQVLRKEVPGFVANRLQSALFRECVHLVSEGVVTMQELDDIVTSSIGQRWAVAGPFRSFHLGGGEGGMPHFMDHFGIGMERRWAAMLQEKVAFDEPTKRLLTEQAKDFGGTVDELAAERDRKQIALMRALGESFAD
ncbi:3-hydroxyacyl-CoA dehydrogenase NAD-binding domain-containing protein [Streptomyces broussonetiae]|uniref:Hydroxylacyl-CoA dehydrogenase n=1 Tax=Streptomyces broussonetiae TaxID=2686304 RepID=A0A6I6NBH9_9ACTN|nr:3-hydroxyacyl-CoA dehydrogenase NAD-binding domain-containing protein [Streptomyces broussonetiae]QHA08842.1 hydroxylacyl-CoA dehydrogenase [Streptomyces broussonetiae]